MGIIDFLRAKQQTQVERGQEVEREFKTNKEITGARVKRTGIGSDHKVTYTDAMTGKKRSELWEEKRNNSPLSKRQKQTPGLKVYRRYDPSPERPFGETRVENRRGDKLEYN